MRSGGSLKDSVWGHICLHLGWGKRGAKAKLSLAERVVGLRIGKYDEFLDEIKEREFIDICATWAVLTKYIHGLKGKARPPEHRGPSIQCFGGSISGRRRCD